MKRKIFSVLAIAAVAFVSCKKEDPAAATEPGTATITGNVEAALDLSNDTTAAGAYSYNLNPEAVTGVKMHIVVNGMDLDPTPDASYNYQDITTHVDITNGTYSATVPAISTPMTVDIYFDDFNADQRQYIAINPDSTVYETHEFFYGPISVGNVTDGATIVQNFTYNW